MFLPAFSFTIIGHDLFERVLNHPRLCTFLDGVTAAVVGLICVVCVSLVAAAVKTPLGMGGVHAPVPWQGGRVCPVSRVAG